MKRFEVAMEAEISVSFSDPDKAKSYFIDGIWSSYFYDLVDMEDLAKSLSQAFHNSDEHYDKDRNAIIRSPEGFGIYIKKENGYYVANWEEFGEITVRYELELEATDAYEVN